MGHRLRKFQQQKRQLQTPTTFLVVFRFENFPATVSLSADASVLVVA
jgi:hypothetical protein